jgi:membrane-bound lytic murein transglycosylase
MKYCIFFVSFNEFIEGSIKKMSKRKFTEEKEDDKKQIECKIVYLQNRQSLHVRGQALMRVISGSVEIHGYATTNAQLHEPIPIYALEQYGVLSIGTNHLKSPTTVNRENLLKTCM